MKYMFADLFSKPQLSLLFTVVYGIFRLEVHYEKTLFRISVILFYVGPLIRAERDYSEDER